jgi:putative membrane-bound dehydrogenase-like protein
MAMGQWRNWVTVLALAMGGVAPLLAADETNEPTSGPGIVPAGEDGKPLNLNFETGDLKDWKAEGNAWEQQPIKGGIDKNRPFGTDKQSLHTGEFWIGGYEKLQDPPQGTLTSVPFKVTHPWASMLVGGGALADTRVELLDEAGKVFFLINGTNAEELSPVIVDLRNRKDKLISVRIVDKSSDGWGHVNFDDFRFHEKRPTFKRQELKPKSLSAIAEVYPHAGLTAEEAAAAMQVPPGFKVQVAAKEPEVTQPIAMCWDDRGRLWVAEAHSYPQRNPEGEGADRIVIFEDTDQNGTLDKKKTFIEGLNLVSGLAVGFDGVWVGAAPYLMFIPDKNGDDVPDAPADPQPVLQFPKDVPAGATVLLDGWHWEDTHETLNAFIWGPDGWLYGCHGVFTHSLVGKPGTPKEQRQPINAGIWRYHPVRHEFEVFAHGSSNPWGVDFNEYGEAFCTACVIPHLYHIIQGGRYERQAGTHFNPHTYNDIKTIARHRHYTGNQWNDNDRKASDDLGGGHAHAGAMVYLGGAWPEEYHGKLFMHNIHGNRINIDQLIPEGSGYAGDRYPDFLLTGDKWSQMINLMTGPDGQVWMIDWYDANQCHTPKEGAHDTTNGRIFRVSYGDVPNPAVDLKKLGNKELFDLAVTAPNEWYSRHARRLIQERVAAAKITEEDGLALLFGESRPEFDTLTPAQQVRILSTLAHLLTPERIQDLAKELKAAELEKVDPRIAAFAVRISSQGTTQLPESVKRRAQLAKESSSPVLRLALASSLSRTALADRWEVLEGLVAHAEDAKDHNLPLMYWYAMEPLADVDPARALALAVSAGETIPVLQEYMIRRLGSGDPAKVLDLLVDALDKAKPEAASLYLRGILSAMRGLKEHPRFADLVLLPTKYPPNSSAPDQVFLSTAIAYRAGASHGITRLQVYTGRTDWPLSVRREILKFVVEANAPGLDELLPKLVLDDAALRGDALRALAAIDNVEAIKPIVEKFGSFKPEERRDAMSTLTSRPSYARELLAAVQANRIPKTELSADLVRQLRNLNDEKLTKQIEEVWGVVRESPADRQALMARLKAVISNPHGSTPDREVGRAIFAKTCQQCHTLFGTGGKVGPDITGANRANLDYLLSNVVDPSAVMAKDYQPSIIVTKSGRVITGIVRQPAQFSKDPLEVVTPEQLLIVDPNDIEERKLSDKSMMPDDLLRNLSDSDVRSLVAYLQGAGQTPLRANRDNVVSFFNGQTLDGWIGKTEKGGLWTVEPASNPYDAVIVGKTDGLPHNEFLVSQLSLTDFRFKCDVLLKDNQGNSGIQIRSAPQSNGEVKGYQADVGPGWWGKLYEELGRGLLENNDAEKHVKPNDWNTYEIVAVGSRVRTYINGKLCVDRDDPAGARSGVIAVQLHSGGATEVRFRHLELTILDQLPPHAAAGSQPNQWPVSRGGAFDGAKISFRKTQLDNVFRSEGVGIADLDNDGDMDIAGGSQIYLQDSQGQQKWTPQAVVVPAKEFDPKGYSDSFMNYADDLNGDGRLDLVVVDFPGKQTWWFENPGKEPEASAPGVAGWTRHEMIPVTNNESPQYLDLNGDGVRELVAGFENGLMGISVRQSHPSAPWKMIAIGAPGTPDIQRFYHGLGIGDVDQDGRADVVVPAGWWKAPEEMTSAPWTFNEAKFGGGCSQMYVFDFDGDGDNDVLSASPHDYGIWWHENVAAKGETPAFKQHEIDKTFSETHAVVLADINGDGLPDFVTGKRWWSHGGHGPGGGEPAVLHWYELKREGGTASWVKHSIDEDSGVGTAFEVADINGDGLLDFAISNKKGTFVFEQERK